MDISHIIPLEDAYKTHRMKLQIVGTTVYTYIDGVKVDYTYSSPYAAFGKLGFREVEGESAYFDNLVITDDDTGRVLYRNDFTTNSKPFTFGTLSNGAFFQDRNYIAEVCNVLPEVGTSAPMFRKTFTASKPIAAARLYATSLGVYEAYLNGKKVGTDKLGTGLDGLYQGIAVPGVRRDGHGQARCECRRRRCWQRLYSGHVSTGGLVNRYGTDEAFLAKLAITYTDGTSEVIVTDTSWRASLDGPYLETCNQNGETYDARKEFPGWDTAAFDDSGWVGREMRRFLHAPAP